MFFLIWSFCHEHETLYYICIKNNVLFLSLSFIVQNLNGFNNHDTYEFNHSSRKITGEWMRPYTRSNVTTRVHIPELPLFKPILCINRPLFSNYVSKIWGQILCLYTGVYGNMLLKGRDGGRHDGPSTTHLDYQGDNIRSIPFGDWWLSHSLLLLKAVETERAQLQLMHLSGVYAFNFGRMQ